MVVDLDEGDDELEDEDEAARLESRGAHVAEGLPSKRARTSSSSGLVGDENELPDELPNVDNSAKGEAAVKPEAGAPPLWPGASLVGEGSQGDPILCL